MKKIAVSAITSLMLLGVSLSACAKQDNSEASDKTLPQAPNIVLVIIDDMGWGDISVSGNPIVKTPQMEKLASESVSFSDFHTDPRCSPTRAALMTGKNSLAVGVLHTVHGRNILPAEFPTMAEILKQNGYETGMFGKWHLGDNYPFRPVDRGFDKVVRMGGGGPSQAWDYWGNDMWGDTYLEDGVWTPFAGYTNDVWFDEAEEFVLEKGKAGKPFFAYLAAGNAHSPWRAPYETLEPYIEMGLPPILARFYATIEEVDTRIGTLRDTLEDAGVADNTIFVVMADNGTPLDYGRVIYGSEFETVPEFVASRPEWKDWEYNSGLRAVKSSLYEGGHRVPLMISWPDGLGEKAKDVSALTAHIDLLPTFVDWLDLKLPENADIEGMSLAGLLAGDVDKLPERKLYLSGQQSRSPNKKRPAVIMTEQWRYLTAFGELYDIDKDKAQNKNVADDNPKIAREMRDAYEKIWAEVAPTIPSIRRPIVGTGNEPEMRLTIIDAALKTNPVGKTILPWNPGFSVDQYGGISEGWIGNETSVPVRDFLVTAKEAGQYNFRFYFHDRQAAKIIPYAKAHFNVNGQHYSKSVAQTTTWVDFDVELEAGNVDFTGWFSNGENLAPGEGDAPAFYVYVSRKE